MFRVFNINSREKMLTCSVNMIRSLHSRISVVSMLAEESRSRKREERVIVVDSHCPRALKSMHYVHIPPLLSISLPGVILHASASCQLPSSCPSKLALVRRRLLDGVSRVVLVLVGCDSGWLVKVFIARKNSVWVFHGSKGPQKRGRDVLEARAPAKELMP
jgi:hypothetical protein